MDKTALRQAKARLATAEAAASTLATAASFDEIDSNWTVFLLTANGIFTKLEQGSKAAAISQAWFATIRKLRRNDPLLRYLQHARNSDEHGIRDSTHRKAVGAEFLWPNGTKSVLRVDHPDARFEEQNTGGVPISRVIRYTDLVTVYDRGIRYEPPDSHLGEEIVTRDPVQIAAMALDCLRSIVAEAEAL